MKRFAKMITAVFMTAAMTTSVFRAAVDITGVTVNSDGTVSAEVTVTEPEENMQYTMLVYKTDDAGSCTIDDAVYINQLKSGEYSDTSEGVSFVITLDVAEGQKYLLRLGATETQTPDEYAFDSTTDTTGGGTSGGETTGLYGDADLNGVLTANDSAVVLSGALDSSFEIKAEFELVDVDGDGEITASDAAQILTKVLNSAYGFSVESE
ncbi:MAG: hypothetical protein LUD77_00805 [Clostridiales bacterium]|nr:hypothetical protein [Clostridiales bacterium]